MAIDTLELSPLFSTKVPPARTGLAVTPMLLKPTKVPDTIFEMTGVDDVVVDADGGMYTERVATDSCTSTLTWLHSPPIRLSH